MIQRSLPLSQLVEPLRAGRSGPNLDPEIHGVQCDSRQVSPGDVFVAIRGAEADGHRFAHDAVSKGAVAIIAEESLADVGVPTIVVPNARQALADVAHRFYGYPSRALTVVGITGTVGKTSTAAVLGAILNREGHKTAVIGSLGVLFPDFYTRTGLTTPSALDLARIMRRVVEAGGTHVVMEVSSHALLQHRVSGVEYDTGVITNILEHEHTDVHPTFEHYVATKSQLIEDLQPDGALIYNGDQKVPGVMAELFSGQRVSFGLRHGQVIADDIEISRRGMRFTLRLTQPVSTRRGVFERTAFTLETPLLGRQNVLNIAAAAATALVHGVSGEIVQDAVRSFRPLRRRMEVVYDNDLTILDDTVGNPASIDALFDTIRHFDRTGLRLVYAIRGGRGIDVNRANAVRLAHWAERLDVDEVVVTGSASHVGRQDRVSDDECRACLDVLEKSETVTFLPELDDAVFYALERGRPGDLILLLGAQGMNAGAEQVEHWLDRRRPPQAAWGQVVGPKDVNG